MFCFFTEEDTEKLFESCCCVIRSKNLYRKKSRKLYQNKRKFQHFKQSKAAPRFCCAATRFFAAPDTAASYSLRFLYSPPHLKFFDGPLERCRTVRCREHRSS